MLLSFSLKCILLLIRIFNHSNIKVRILKKGIALRLKTKKQTRQESLWKYLRSLNFLHANASLSPSATVNINFVTVLHTIKIIPTIPFRNYLLLFSIPRTWGEERYVGVPRPDYSIIKSHIPRIPLYPWSCSSQTITRKSPPKRKFWMIIAFGQHAPSVGVELSWVYYFVAFIIIFFSVFRMAKSKFRSLVKMDGGRPCLTFLCIWLIVIRLLSSFGVIYYLV